MKLQKNSGISDIIGGLAKNLPTAEVKASVPATPMPAPQPKVQMDKVANWVKDASPKQLQEIQRQVSARLKSNVPTIASALKPKPKA